MRRKQKFVALSAAKENYITTSMASYEEIWLRNIFRELFEQVLDTTMIYCNSKSGIRLAENPIFHENSKHIEI